ncbi:MAG: hypothetical protein JNL28_02980 [Planctomycetes bacterium]|nr:hypothetical protein [Planctomycetota bacterium]
MALLVTLTLAGCNGGGTTEGSIESLSVADSMTVVTTNSSGSAASVTPGSQADTSGFAATSNYRTDQSNSRVYDPSMEPLGTVNMILCLLKQTAYSGLLNVGLYKAQIDEKSCESGNGDDSASGTGQSSGAAQSFNLWVIRSSRPNRTGAQELLFWIPGTNGDGQIRVRVSVTKGVSTENPFGVFNLNYIQYESDNLTVRGLGNLHTLDAAAGFAGFSFYQEEGDVDVVHLSGEQSSRIQANVLMSADQTTGSARIVATRRENHGSGDSGQQTSEYRIAFDETHVLRETDGDGGVCLSRTTFSTRTWRYNLYNASTGQRINLNSGFGFQTAGGAYGWAGYNGLWVPNGVTLPDGSIVTRNSYGQSTPQTYTVLKARGKLIKNTRQTLDLTALAGETFEWWHSNSGPAVRKLVAYNAPDWQVIATWDDNTQQWVNSAPSNIDTATLGHLGMWSQSLGGPVAFVHGEASITFFERELVTPSSSLFAASNDVPLYGFDRCLKAAISSSDATAGDIYYPDSTQVVSPYIYTAHKTEMTFTIDVSSTPTEVGLGDAQAPTGGNYMWGMQSGALVTADVLAGLTTPASIYSSSVFYTYETGHNSWNQFAILFDATEHPVVFDKPIQFAYTHTTGDDANADTTYNGRTYFLAYNGPGELHGIPHMGVDFNNDGNPDRWYPQFSIKNATLMGPTGAEYVVRAIESEQNLADDTGNCGSLTAELAAAATLALPAVTDWVDPALGPMPTVNEAPRAIAGIVVGSSN